MVPLQHWLCQDSPRPQCQLQWARLGSGTGSSPAQGATTAGCPRRAGTEGSKGHGGAKGQRGTGWGVPPWLARSIQPRMSSSKGDRPPFCPGQAPRPPPSPVWERSTFLPSPGPSVPAAPQPDPASKCLSKLTGCKLFLPFSCYSSLAGHRSEQLLPRTHERQGRARGRFGEQGGLRASITGTQRSSSSTEEGSPVCSRSAAEGCPLSGRRSFHCKKLSCHREGDTGTVAQTRDAPR